MRRSCRQAFLQTVGHILADDRVQHQLFSFSSSTYFASIMACSSTNTSIMPVAPNSLRLAQASVEKLKATYRLVTPSTKKNRLQLRLTRFHTRVGSVSFSCSRARIRFFLNSRLENSRVAANTQYSAVGFHLMKFSSCSR